MQKLEDAEPDEDGDLGNERGFRLLPGEAGSRVASILENEVVRDSGHRHIEMFDACEVLPDASDEPHPDDIQALTVNRSRTRCHRCGPTISTSKIPSSC